VSAASWSGEAHDQGAITLRALTEDDLPAVDPWFADPETVRRLGGPDWPRQLLVLARAPGRHAFLALAGAEPVGLADVEEEPGPPSRAVLALLVAPGRRGQRVGRRILDALAGRRELEDVPVLAGEVEAGNAAGLALARAAGGAPSGRATSAGFVALARPRDPGAARAVALEHRLLLLEVRRDPAAVLALLHPDFREIGASGRTWDGPSVAGAVAADPGVPVTADEVEAAVLAPGVVLVTYTAVRGDARSRRSSVWLADADADADGGGWRLRFHQGTPA
jgi:ribonuclease HI